MDLFRQVSLQVGSALGYTYPEQLHERVLEYVEQIQQQQPGE